ncbi:MAG: J domain-containing protein [Patescibacteria group bacterium]|nr:J domain-containing protein [Patescibacteria group bacterium]
MNKNLYRAALAVDDEYGANIDDRAARELRAYELRLSWWETLGVDSNASVEQVKASWLELSKIHHPDVGGSHERMAQINAAFEQAKVAWANGGMR